jgi:hypothetical protein
MILSSCPTMSVAIDQCDHGLTGFNPQDTHPTSDFLQKYQLLEESLLSPAARVLSTYTLTFSAKTPKAVT